MSQAEEVQLLIKCLAGSPLTQRPLVCCKWSRCRRAMHHRDWDLFPASPTSSRLTYLTDKQRAVGMSFDTCDAMFCLGPAKMKDLLLSPYWIRVKYETASLQRAAKPIIHVLKIPFIDKEPKLKMRGSDVNINELLDVLFFPNGWPTCQFAFEDAYPITQSFINL